MKNKRYNFLIKDDHGELEKYSYTNSLNVLFMEYESRTQEILKRVEFQQNILRGFILLITAILAAIVHFLSSSFDKNYFVIFLLISPFPFYLLSWSFSNHDFMIAANGRYINIKLRPRILEIVKLNLLDWEEFLNNERAWRSRHLKSAMQNGEEYFLPLLIPIIFTSLSCVMLLFQYKHNLLYLFNINHLKYIYENPAILLKAKLNHLYPICEGTLIFFNAYLIHYTKKIKDLATKNYERIIN